MIDIEPAEPSQADLSALPPITSSPEEVSSPTSSSASIRSIQRRKTYKPEEDVCFPTEEPSPKASWPDYNVLEEWAAQESKALDEGSSAARREGGGFLPLFGHRKVSEPVLVDGRYRRPYSLPPSTLYSVAAFVGPFNEQTEESRPYRFMFFTDKLTTTIHAPTISELVDEGQNFCDLFEGEGSECWWLDVCGVTDEEMRLLSRVLSSPCPLTYRRSVSTH